MENLKKWMHLGAILLSSIVAAMTAGGLGGDPAGSALLAAALNGSIASLPE